MTDSKCSKKGLGDKVEAVTGALGIKSCAGCKKRKTVLNTISRRGVIGGGLFSLFLIKNGVLSGSWKLFGAEPPVDFWAAMAFVRQCNTNAAGWMFRHNYTYLTLQELLSDIAAHRKHFPPDHPGYAWMSKFTPLGDQVLPGWTIDYYTDGKQYCLMLKGETYTVATDERGFINKTLTVPGLPSAKEVWRRENLPNSVDYNEKMEVPASRSQRLRDFFLPLSVLAQSGCCPSNGCNLRSCSCADCIGDVSGCSGCDCSLCRSSPVTHSCFWNAACSGPGGQGVPCGTGGTVQCGWYLSPCGTGNCQCCAGAFGQCCTSGDCIDACVGCGG